MEILEGGLKLRRSSGSPKRQVRRNFQTITSKKIAEVFVNPLAPSWIRHCYILSLSRGTLYTSHLSVVENVGYDRATAPLWNNVPLATPSVISSHYQWLQTTWIHATYSYFVLTTRAMFEPIRYVYTIRYLCRPVQEHPPPPPLPIGSRPSLSCISPGQSRPLHQCLQFKSTQEIKAAPLINTCQIHPSHKSA